MKCDRSQLVPVESKKRKLSSKFNRQNLFDGTFIEENFSKSYFLV